MGVIADLMVKVGADVASFKAGMAEVNADTKTAGESTSKFGGLAAGAGLLAVGAVTGVVAFGLAAVDHANAAGQAAYEMGEKFGMAGSQASSWMSVGKQLGLSGEQIGKGFQFLSRNVSAMAITLEAGGKISATQGQVYKDLGINVMDAHGKIKSADELMMEAADAFKNMADGPEKAALSMKLFGKSGTDLLPMLNEGREGITKLMEAGKKQGDVMTNSQVKAAHDAYLEHKKLDAAVSGLTTQVGTGLMPAELGLATVLTDKVLPALGTFLGWVANIRTNIQTLQPWFPLLAGGLTVLGGVMGAILIPMFIAWTVATWAQVVALGAQAIALVAATWPLLLIILTIGLVVAAVVLLIQHWGLVKSKTLEVWGDILAWFRALPGVILGAVGSFDRLLVDAGAALMRGLLAGIRSAPGAIMDAIKSLLPGGAGGALAMGLAAAGVPGFQFGGIVPGPPGAPRLILAHGGERVSTADQQAQGGSGGDIYVSVTAQTNADPYEIAGEVGWQLRILRRAW